MSEQEMSDREQAEVFIATLPGGIKRDVEITYSAYGNFQQICAIRHWLEIPGTHRGSTSGWICDGYTSSRQYAGMIAEALHKSFGYNYEVWSLRSFGSSQGPHILDFVPGLQTDTAKLKGERKQVTEQDVMRFSQQWVIDYYGIHESNYQYVKAVSCEPPTHNRVWRCTVQFSHLGERVELHMHNLPEGLNVFTLHYPLPEESE